MTIVEHFNPHKIGHMVAFDELQKTGKWPKGFADGLEFPQFWVQQLDNKVATAYATFALKAGGMKQKLHQAKVRLMGNANKTAEAEIAVAVMGEIEPLLIE